MEFTRRYAVIVGLVFALVATAILVDRPFPLMGAVGIGAWLLAHQVRFVRRAGRTVELLTVDVAIEDDPVVVDRDVRVVVDVTTPDPAPLAATVFPTIPTAGRTVEPPDPVTIPVGGASATLAYPVRFPVAGTYEFDPVTIELADEHGLFSTRLDAGGGTSVTVEPSVLRNLRVGRAGERAESLYGDDPGPRATRGLEPEEIRPYRVGDLASHIDWRATARLNELHVREFSLDVRGRSAGLLVDARERLVVGPAGETMLDYARAVGLAYLTGAVGAFTQFSLYFLDEDSVRWMGDLGEEGGGYHRLRQALQDLSPDGRDEPSSRPTTVSPTSYSPDLPRSVVGSRLAAGTSSFDRGLRPFFDTRPQMERQGTSASFVSAVSTWQAASNPPRETILVTDDADRTVLREAIAQATEEGGRVTALLLPRVLFEADHPVELETAYDRYRSFETFRRGLDRRPDVTALEVGPGDRIDAILAAGTGR